MRNFDVVIIGSGLGGLLCANILSKEGLHVAVLEKHHTPGGNLQTFKKGGYTFETGMHYLGSMGEGQPLNRYWRHVGLTDKIQIRQLDIDGFDIISMGDTAFPLAQGSRNFIDQLLPYFPDSREVLKSYMEKLEEVAGSSPLYNLELPALNTEEIYKTQGALHYYQTLAGGVFSKNQSVPLSSVLSGNGFLYAGDASTPMHTAAIINHSFISGAYRISGGSDGIAKILCENITANGGQVIVKKEAQKIEKRQDTFYIQSSDGDAFQSKRVISAIHPALTLSMMPESMVRPAFRRRINSLANTPGSFSLHLTLKPGCVPYLNKNFYIHSGDGMWQNAAAGNPGSMYLLSMPAPLKEQQFAETATILSYDSHHEYARWAGTTSGKRGQDYLDFKQMKAESLLRMVGKAFPELVSAIRSTDISTPLTYRDYTGTPEGSLYGIRRDHRDHLTTTVLPITKIPDFFFTGQNTNLHGALGVTIGAVATCGAVIGLDHLLKKIRNG
jgi:all-trans-retinol 13,14-reductase